MLDLSPLCYKRCILEFKGGNVKTREIKIIYILEVIYLIKRYIEIEFLSYFHDFLFSFIEVCFTYSKIHKYG